MSLTATSAFKMLFISLVRRGRSFGGFLLALTVQATPCNVEVILIVSCVCPIVLLEGIPVDWYVVLSITPARNPLLSTHIHPEVEQVLWSPYVWPPSFPSPSHMHSYVNGHMSPWHILVPACRGCIGWLPHFGITGCFFNQEVWSH